MRMGTNDVGASAIRMGESLCVTTPGCLFYMLHWHSQVPCFIESRWVRWWPCISFWVVYYLLFLLGSFFSRVWGRPPSYGRGWWYVVWVVWLECWIRPVSCINVKQRSRTLGMECGDILIVNIIYILSLAYIDVIVPCNALDVWELGSMGLCSSLGHQWTPKRTYYNVIGLCSDRRFVHMRHVVFHCK